jgi:cytochrome c-type biogenesis protein CcmH/NrfG
VRNFILVSAVMLVVAVWWMWPSATEPLPIESASVKAEEKSAPVQPNIKTEESAAPKAAPQSDSGFTKRLAETSMPKLASIREHAQQNPHGPSPEHLKFAADVFDLRASVRDEPEAEQLMLWLGHCALNKGDEQVSQTAQAICLRNAGQLAGNYSSLKTQLEEIRMRAPADVVAQVEFLATMD